MKSVACFTVGAINRAVIRLSCLRFGLASGATLTSLVLSSKVKRKRREVVKGAADPARRAHANAATYRSGTFFFLYLKTDRGRPWVQEATGANRQENNLLGASCGCD